MRNIYLYLLLLGGVIVGACHDDQSYKQDEPEGPEPEGHADIRLALTGRVGSVVGDSLTEYVDALNLLLFRENAGGEYVLYRQRLLTKEQLNALADADENADAGFTAMKEVAFDTVPVGYYRIAGVGNVLDSVGGVQANASLRGAAVGASMTEVLAQVTDGSESPRLFWGMTEAIDAGGDAAVLPVLRLYRKVSMFELTLLKIPDVVDRIDMMFEHTYSSFNMEGDFTRGSENWVYDTRGYEQQVQDSIRLNYVMLPTVAGDSTTIEATFYLSGGGKQPVTLPKYVLRPNTITKVTATIDPDQLGNAWKVNINSLITVNVEWNVDQEPPIII